MSQAWVRTVGVAVVVIAVCGGSARAQVTIPSTMSEESLGCVECHATQTAGIYQQWGTSKHYRANVGCYECHRAEKGDADGVEHRRPVMNGEKVLDRIVDTMLAREAEGKESGVILGQDGGLPAGTPGKAALGEARQNER